MRKRETADVGGACSKVSCCGGGGRADGVELVAGAEGKDSEDAVKFVVDSLTGGDKATGVVDRVGTELPLSTLARGAPTPTDEEATAIEALLGGRTGDAERLELATGGDAGPPLRPKKDSKPPLAFFLASVAGEVTSFSFSITRQPGGNRSSFKISGLDFTEVSHAVDPLDAK